MAEKKHKQTVLVVDDMRTNALALKKMLAEEWNVEVALNGPAALEAADGPARPDLILLDVRMPDMDGHEVCRRLKESAKTRDIPVIFITAMDDWNNEAQGLALGAVDYITKPVRAPIVRARIRNHIALRKALTELDLKNMELERLAERDQLTGLYNRRKLDDSLAQEIIRSERYGRPLSVILIDIDHFKNVNDTYGHQTGDTVLVESATRLSDTLRTSDIAGRWGGEEFLVICPETSLEAAQLLAERLRKDYTRRDFSEAGTLTASFGVAAHRKGLKMKDVVRRADQALYRAKEGGRNRVESEGDETR
jgi:diguanylate cyclase (GGDEF)-like protein